MKKIITMGMALILSVSLVACAGKSNVPQTTENVTTASTEAVSENTESTTQITTEAQTTTETTPEITVTLKDVFAEHNMKVGTCITGNMISNANQLEIIKSNFNSLTMENAMKPDAILSQRLSKENGEIMVKFGSETTKILDFAKNNGYSMRGHTLVWYSQTPNWIFYEGFDTKNELVSREVMLERMESLIKNTFAALEEGGYIDLFYAYDVVNEAWMENGTMRDCLWKQVIGDDYLWYAFYYANKYAPESIDLYYNDYNEQYKTDTLVKFVNTLVDEEGNYLIDGIGLQAHLYTSDSLDSYFKMIDTLAETGLKIQMTELDICLGAWQKPLDGTDENFQKQGRYVYNLINGIFERVDAGTLKMDALTFWGFSDRLSWRKEYSPLLYNSRLEPKYAYYGALQIKEMSGFEE